MPFDASSESGEVRVLSGSSGARQDEGWEKASSSYSGFGLAAESIAVLYFWEIRIGVGDLILNRREYVWRGGWRQARASRTLASTTDRPLA